MPPSVSEIEVELSLDVNVNGTSFHCAGRAVGAPGLGSLVATVESDRDLPAGFDISLLTYVCLTGDPAMGQTVGRVTNPFAEKREFRATRVLDLGDHGSLTTTWVASEPAGAGRREEFQVTGNVDTPRLVSLEPTIETWTPVAPGRFDGQFALVWRGVGGEVVRGRTTSQYYLPDDYELPCQMYRDIRFAIRSDRRRLWQTEHIVIFGPDQFETQLNAIAPPIDRALALAGTISA